MNVVYVFRNHSCEYPVINYSQHLQAAFIFLITKNAKSDKITEMKNIWTHSYKYSRRLWSEHSEHCVIKGGSRDTNLWQLFSDITTHKHSFQIDPQILYNQPIFNDFCGTSQLLYPFLDLWLEWSIVSEEIHTTCNDYNHATVSFWRKLSNLFFWNTKGTIKSNYYL